MLFAIGNDPGNENGSLVVDVAMNGDVTFQYLLAEQGSAICMLDTGTDIIIPGIDPTESWDFGNVYVDGIKKRTLPNVIHALGACLHNGYLFVATGVHLGDETTFRGYVFRSSDLGDTWDAPVQVSNYRVYDIISFNNLLYAVGDNSQDFFLTSSSDDGLTWNVVNGVIPSPRMFVFGSLLIILDSNGNIRTIDTLGNIETYAPPAIVDSEWNIFAANGSYLYVLCGDALYRTTDFETWEWHCDLERPCTGLVVWPDFGLIVSEIGTDARLLRIPFA